jgi:hypothetical protein
MHQLSLKKYRRRDDVLDDASAIWEVKEIPGVQLAKTLRTNRIPKRYAWRVFLSPRLAIRRRPELGYDELSNDDQAAIALVESLRGKVFTSRRDAMQALEVEVLLTGIDLGLE